MAVPNKVQETGTLVVNQDNRQDTRKDCQDVTSEPPSRLPSATHKCVPFEASAFLGFQSKIDCARPPGHGGTERTYVGLATCVVKDTISAACNNTLSIVNNGWGGLNCAHNVGCTLSFVVRDAFKFSHTHGIFKEGGLS